MFKLKACVVKKDVSFQRSNDDWPKTSKLFWFSLVHSSPSYSCKFCRIFHRLLGWFHNDFHNFDMSLHWQFQKMQWKYRFRWFSFFDDFWDVQWQLAEKKNQRVFLWQDFDCGKFILKATYKAFGFSIKSITWLYSAAHEVWFFCFCHSLV